MTVKEVAVLGGGNGALTTAARYDSGRIEGPHVDCFP